MTGWLLGNAAASASEETLCYQDGELVDCGTLPDDVRSVAPAAG